MKQFLTALAVLLIFMLPVSVMAATEATNIQSATTVGQNGGCTVTVTVRLHLDTAESGLSFPLPPEAEDVLLNNLPATVTYTASQALVALPELNAGDYSITLSYRLEDVVHQQNGQTLVSIPLLSGFSRPIKAMEFTVTMPGEITFQPSFSSGYHQQDIASAISCTVSGNTISASLIQPLKDHETLVLTLPADEDMFPFVITMEPLIDGWDGSVLLCGFFAVVYYALTLMPSIWRRGRCFGVPDGISAGEVGTCLTGAGVDLALMVITWAQLGYVELEPRSKQQVILRKRMDMGNERSPLELDAFRTLFGKRNVVDSSGLRYARLSRKLSLQAPMTRHYFKPNSGRPGIFRFLSGAAGILSGVKLGMAFAQHTDYQVLAAVLTCLVCGIFSYLIQSGGKCLPLRNKMPLLVALLCALLWICLGSLAGQLSLVAPVVIFELVAGIAIAFGGRRSELGKHSLSQIWGLRHYMVSANTFDLQQRLQANPDYFYALAPYALALGVDKRFARRFGKTPLPDHSFLHTPSMRNVTAVQWAARLRLTVDALHASQKRLPHQFRSRR